MVRCVRQSRQPAQVAVITFTDDFTIYLNSTLAVSNEVTIDGSGHAIIVSGDSNGDGSRDVQPFSIGVKRHRHPQPSECDEWHGNASAVPLSTAAH